MIGRELTKRYEGYSETIYKDTLGNLTVGYGVHLYPGKKVPREILNVWFTVEYQSAELELYKLSIKAIDNIRRAVLVDLIYNMGITRVLSFKKMIAALKQEDYNKAADELLDSDYAKQTKTRAQTNAEILRTGQWPSFLKE